MSKASKQKTRMEQARKTARLLVLRRDELSKLTGKAEKGGELTEDQLFQVGSLIKRIENLKVSLERLDLDVDEAVRWAASERKKKKTAKGSAPKRRRGGGVGMYGLGNSIKVWR